MANFDKIVKQAFKFEGGFQNFPEDSANYCEGKLIGTNRGISAIGYKAAFGKCPTVQQIKDLSEEQAKEVYKRNYWDKIKGDEIENDSVAALMFQFIIGSGQSQISDLKDIANKTKGENKLSLNDKPFTSEEINFINSLNQFEYFTNMKTWRRAFFIRLTELKPEKKKFLKGWLNRLDAHEFELSTKKKILISLVLSILVFSSLFIFIPNFRKTDNLKIQFPLWLSSFAACFILSFLIVKIYETYLNS